MNVRGLILASAVIALLPFPTEAASLSPEEAASRIGQEATVCGIVASTKFDAHLPSQPTFLDFGKPYPDQSFTAVIFGTDRAKFGKPETVLQQKHVCVTGSIRNDQGKPEIVLTDPAQLTR
jgi:hypothetical protein